MAPIHPMLLALLYHLIVDRQRVAGLVVPTVEVVAGQANFTIPCVAAAGRGAAAVAAAASSDFAWMFNGTFVRLPGTRVGQDGSLEFVDIRPENTGGYSCAIAGVQRNLASPDTLVVVRERTRSQKQPQDVALLEGSGNVHLHCVFTYDFALHDSLQVYWLFNNGNVTTKILSTPTKVSGRVSSVSYQGRAYYLQYPYRKVSSSYQTLTIRDVTLEDDGFYTCMAQTKLDQTSSRPARVDVKKKTEILVHPADVSGTVGLSLSLECQVSIDSSLVGEAEVFWTKDSRATLSSRTSMQPISLERQNLVHRIPRVGQEDAGTYRCHVITPFDSKDSNSARLSIRKGTVLVQEPENVQVAAGGSAEFACSATTDPSLADSLTITWLRNEKPIDEWRGKILKSGDGSRLSLTELEPRDSGTISCIVATTIDTLRSRVGVLVVWEPTRIVEATSGNMDIVEGSEVGLECRATTDETFLSTLRVLWYKDGKLLDKDDQRVAVEGPGHVDIKIRSASRSDTGEYQCKARSGRDADTAMPVRLTVLQATTITEGPSNQEVVEGGRVELTCRARTDPQLAKSLVVDWYRHGVLLAPRPGLLKTSDDSLVLVAARLADTGAYQCKASTMLDSVESGLGEVTVYARSRITVEPAPANITKGSPFSLQCKASVDEQLLAGSSWRWLLNGSLATWDTASADGQTSQLIVTSADRSLHEGEYSCGLSTRLDSANSLPASVRIFERSLAVVEPARLTLLAGQPASLACRPQVDNRLSPEISWSKDNGDALLTATATTEVIYRLDAAQLFDSGSYSCHVRTALDETAAVIQVSVRQPAHAKTAGGRVQRFAGQPLELPCSAAVDPDLAAAATVTWLKNGTTLVHQNSAADAVAPPAGLLEHNLSLETASMEDEGEYICRLVTSLETLEVKYQVDVYSAVVENSGGGESKTVLAVAGRSGTELACTVEIDPRLAGQVSLSWTRDSRSLGKGTQSMLSDSVLSGALSLGNVGMEAAGTYTCHVDTPLGSAPILTRYLTVLPHSSVKLNYSGEVEVVRGSRVVVGCSATMAPELTEKGVISWLRGGSSNRITGGAGGEGNVLVMPDNSLVIGSADKEAAGLYTCSLTTVLDTAEDSVRISVLKRTRIVQQPEHVTIIEGEAGQLSCLAAADPKLQDSLTVKWRHNRTELIDGETSSSEGGVLSVLRLVGEASLAGRYDCVASTRLDTVNSKPAFLKIQADVDCVVSEWGSWSTCSRTCGGGTHTRSRVVVLGPKGQGKPCDELIGSQPCNLACCVPECSSQGVLQKSDSQPCGVCVCKPGYAGPGSHCGEDGDADGWPDEKLPCDSERCRPDNCRSIPNSGQEDVDGDGLGDQCDEDADGDGLLNHIDNCPLRKNPDQRDEDRDGVGDGCDNCPTISNKLQQNIDNDALGDDCDDDKDNDELPNSLDNCPGTRNMDQADMDRDGVGDLCDNCPDIYNPRQEDVNHNLIGDACDDGYDSDLDGIPDLADNCPYNDNADQLDVDGDGVGDDCDDDADGDDIVNTMDNCPLLANPGQEDADEDGVGDACFKNFDGDAVADEFDSCPQNARIEGTDFRAMQPIAMGANTWGQPVPEWEFQNEGKEISQKVNSAPGIAIGAAKMAGVDFEGTFFVGEHEVPDNDFIGVIFSFQDSSNFYLVMSARDDSGLVNCQGPCHQGNWQIKRVNSLTGPYTGTVLSDAIRNPYSVEGETTLLWKADPSAGGWREGRSYRFRLLHRPRVGIIRLWLYEGSTLVADSGTIIDDGGDSLRGGRLGVYCDSQEQITWSALSYRCSSTVPPEVYSSLPPHLRNKVTVA